ncbi:MAG: Asp-tRNA(Asn)/Glu-tRNA(Gln) amidotransferase subunit GatC [Candidatus Staskawiczbacteria bacterium]|nr:Asp-tRNA(Asn)/Glu-tRNA(Gln) amidotransferase subunit GatC [Candidatus Staskawiczbacteria bacterium]
MISKEEVQHIASLARLELSEQEIGKMQKDLTEILDYFKLLNKAPTKISRRENLGGQAQNLRKDEVISQDREVVEKLVAAAPDKKDGYIKVKTIL